jgi:hypothetical protein
VGRLGSFFGEEVEHVTRFSVNGWHAPHYTALPNAAQDSRQRRR